MHDLISCCEFLGGLARQVEDKMLIESKWATAADVLDSHISLLLDGQVHMDITSPIWQVQTLAQMDLGTGSCKLSWKIIMLLLKHRKTHPQTPHLETGPFNDTTSHQKCLSLFNQRRTSATPTVKPCTLMQSRSWDRNCRKSWLRNITYVSSSALRITTWRVVSSFLLFGSSRLNANARRSALSPVSKRANMESQQYQLVSLDCFSVSAR